MDRQTVFIARRGGSALPALRGGLLSVVVLGCLMAIPQRVWAEEQETVQTALISVRRLYDDLEYERALEQLSQARRYSATAEDDVLLSLYEGVILADLGRTEASEAAFKAALILQVDAQLPVTVSPKVEQRVEVVRQQVKRELDARKRMAQVQSPRDAPLSAPIAKGTSREVRPSPPPSAVAPTAPALDSAHTTPAAGVSRNVGMRSRAWMPAALGGVLLVGGGVSYAMALSERSSLRNDDAGLATLQDVDRSVSRGRTYQSVGLGLAGAGVVGLGLAAGMYLLGTPSESKGVGLTMSTDGTSAFVSGRWR